ncbi:MAG: FG-GAP-like repeat-containing protein [Bacteroidetes bacterium]|nr:FG-GAP-like repeat-containing protein [Bacteroidota bacterium]MCY4205676.1 FG-GAP-like repeat-containing protein [Bacteroidota bacterium]
MLRFLVCGLCAFVFFVASLDAQPFTFSSIRPISLNEIEHGQILYADLDRDGIFDLFGTGNSENLAPFVPRTYIALSQEPYFFSDGSEGLRFSERALGQGLWQSSMAMTDFNRDGLIDIVVSGRIHNGSNFDTRPLQGVTYLYQGGSSTSFRAVSSNLLGVYGGRVSAADIDGDGDEDLLIMGLRNPEEIVASFYYNVGGTFEPVIFPFEPLAMGDVEWADIDNDGDLDLAISGVSSTGAFRTKLYRNNGRGDFSEYASSLPGLAFSAMDWGDYDNDGDLDLALSGGQFHGTKYFEPVVQIWRNDSGRLVDSGIQLASVMHGDLAWGDYDSDGGLDLVVVGRTGLRNERSGLIYRNEEGNLIPRISISGAAASNAIWGDYDGDNDLDMMIAGSNVSANPLMRIYRNNAPIVNSAPDAPTNLEAKESGGVITLTWQEAGDQETASASLSYNLRIGTVSGKDDVMSSYSDPVTGHRFRSGRGNAGLQSSWKLYKLPAGDYYWSVQAIDQSSIASEWSVEGQFSTSGGGKLTSVEEFPLHATTLDAGYPNPFREAVTLPFTLEDRALVEISIYNVLGGLVKQLIHAPLTQGNHQVQWAGTDETGAPVAPGLYLARMNAGSTPHVQRITLIR